MELGSLVGRVVALLATMETSTTPATLAEAAALLALPTTLHCRPGGLAESEGGIIVTPPTLVLVSSQEGVEEFKEVKKNEEATAVDSVSIAKEVEPVTAVGASRLWGNLGAETDTRKMEEDFEISCLEEEQDSCKVQHLSVLEVVGRQVEVVGHSGPGRWAPWAHG